MYHPTVFKLYSKTFLEAIVSVVVSKLMYLFQQKWLYIIGTVLNLPVILSDIAI